MAAGSKTNWATNLVDRLNCLSCPYSEGADETWITEIIFKPGEQRLRVLQWILSRFDAKIAELLDPTASFLDNTVDSRIQKLLFVISNLGLCKYDDVDLIRGVGTSASRQLEFFNQLLDIVTTCDNAEDPMTKSLLTPGVLSEASSLEDQLIADSRYMDTLATQQLPAAIFVPTVDLLPPDLQRRVRNSKEFASASPDLQRLARTCQEMEGNLLRQLDVLSGVRKMTLNEHEASSGPLLHASRSLDLILRELSQLVLSFTYCYETEAQPWCCREPPYLSQVGPAFKRVHALLVQFSETLVDLRKVRHSHISLCRDMKEKIKLDKEAMLLVDAGQEAAESFQECVDILETSINRQNLSPSLKQSLSVSMRLCSSTLKLT